MRWKKKSKIRKFHQLIKTANIRIKQGNVKKGKKEYKPEGCKEKRKTNAFIKNCSVWQCKSKIKKEYKNSEKQDGNHDGYIYSYNINGL